MKWVLARHTDDGTAGVSRLVRGGSDPYGLSSVVPSGFVLPRGFVEGIIRKDETCPPRVRRSARCGPFRPDSHDARVPTRRTPRRLADWPAPGQEKGEGLSADATL